MSEPTKTPLDGLADRARSAWSRLPEGARRAAESAWSRLPEAARRGQWPGLVPSRPTGSRGYCELGFGPVVLGLAFVLTLLTYLPINAVLNARIDGALRDFRSPALRGARTVAEAAEALTRPGLADPALRPWLEAHLALDAPASRQIDRLFGSISASESGAADRERLLTDLAAGSRRAAWPFGYTSARIAAASEAYDVLADADPRWRDELAAGDPSAGADPAAREALLRLLIAQVVGETEGPVRDLLRINGPIQWLTVLLTWVIVVLAARRALFLRGLRADWSRGIPEPAEAEARGDAELVAIADLLLSNQAAGASRAELTMIHQEEFGRLASGVEDRTYALLAFLLGCLPSLGFIGTILGMGEALLLANGLLNAADRERTIGQMTQQLGFAFDTTLVALVCGLAAGCLVAWVRDRERRWLQDLESGLVARVLPPAVGQGVA